jgi:hypothetical protein
MATDLWELKYFDEQGRETVPSKAVVGPVETAVLMGKDIPKGYTPAPLAYKYFKTPEAPTLTTQQKSTLLKNVASLDDAVSLAKSLDVKEIDLIDSLKGTWLETAAIERFSEAPSGTPSQRPGFIPITQAELDTIAQAEAKGQCVGAMRSYYTPKTYKVTLKGGDVIYVDSLDETTAKSKAEGEGYDVAWVTRQFGAASEATTPEPKLTEGQQWVKDYLQEKGAWKDEYLSGDGFDLLKMYEDSLRGDTELHPRDDLQKIFGREAVNEASAVLRDNQQRIRDFEQELKEMPEYFQSAYANAGLEGYNAAVAEWNRLQDRWQSWDELQDKLLESAVTVGDMVDHVTTKATPTGLPEGQQRLIEGLTAEWQQMSPSERRQARRLYIESKPPDWLADYDQYLTMFKPAGVDGKEYEKIKPHMYLERDGMIGIDIVGAVEAKVPDGVIKDVTGADDEALEQAKWIDEFEDAGFLNQQKMLIEKDPKEYTQTMAGLVGEMAITLIPVYGTYYMAKRPEKYGIGWTVASGVTDALILVAGVGAISKAVKMGVSLPRAIASTGFSIARDTALTPYTILRHPWQTAKGVGSLIRSPFEMIFHSKALPLASVWRGTYDDGFSIAKVLAGSPDEAVATQKAMAKQFKLITEGKATSGKVDIPGFGELKFSATGLQKEMPNITFHATPYGMHYKGVGVDIGKEGLFTANQALLGLDQSSATGQSVLYVFKGKKWLGALDEMGQFLDTSGRVRGGLQTNAKLIDLKGGSAFRYAGNGQITDKTGDVIGILKDGAIYSDDPATIGRYYKGVNEFYGDELCTINKEGMLVNSEGQVVGKTTDKLVGFIPDGAKVMGVEGATVGKVKSQPAFVMITSNGVSPLPAGAEKATTMQEMEKIAWRAFQSGDATNDLYPVFKQYAIFIEDEGLIPKGSKLIPVLDGKGKPVILTTRDITGRKIEMPVMQLVTKEWFQQALTVSRELAKYPTPALDSVKLSKVLVGTENIPKKSVPELITWLRQNREATLAGSASEMVFSNGKIVAKDWDIVVPKPNRLMGNEIANIIMRTSGKRTRVAVTPRNIVVEVLDKGLWKKAVDIDSVSDLTASWKDLPAGLAGFGYKTIDGVNVQTPASQMTGLFDRMSRDFTGKGYSRWYRYASALRGEFDIGIGAKPPSQAALRRIQARGPWNTVRDIFVPVLQKIRYDKIETLTEASKANRIAAAKAIAPDLAGDVRKLISAEERILELARKYRASEIGSSALLRTGEKLLEAIDQWRRQYLELEDAYYTRAYLLARLERQVPGKDLGRYEAVVDQAYRQLRADVREGRRPSLPTMERRRVATLSETERLPRAMREDVERLSRYEEIPTTEELRRLRLTEQMEQITEPGLMRRRINIPKRQYRVRIVEKDGKKYYKIPEGSITWKQGMFWKYIPPPWVQEKPISLKYPPEGAKNIGERTPEQTIQMLGDPGAKVPKEVAIDLGVVDIMIKNYGKDIKFTGKGLETVVGKSLSTATKGMSIPGGGKMKKKPRKLEASVSL